MDGSDFDVLFIDALSLIFFFSLIVILGVVLTGLVEWLLKWAKIRRWIGRCIEKPVSAIIMILLIGHVLLEGGGGDKKLSPRVFLSNVEIGILLLRRSS